MWDQNYEYVKDLIQWDPDKTEFVTSITRVQRFSGEEYMLYSERIEGHDPIYGHRKHVYRSKLGKFLEPKVETVRIPNEEVVRDPNLSLNGIIKGIR
jgi:hypothetical protein